MTNVEEIRRKVWNIELIVDDIKQFPQTYNTILKDLVTDGTCQMILRRKLNSLYKDGTICKTSIPGTRFGQAIFYFIPKEYNIIVEAGRAGSNVYVFFKFKKLSKFFIETEDCWQLEHKHWVKIPAKNIFEGNVLKWL